MEKTLSTISRPEIRGLIPGQLHRTNVQRDRKRSLQTNKNHTHPDTKHTEYQIH